MAKWYNIIDASLMTWQNFVEWVEQLKKDSMSYRTDLLTEKSFGKNLLDGKKRTGVVDVSIESPGRNDNTDEHTVSLLAIKIDGIVYVMIDRPLRITNDPDDVASQVWDNMVEEAEREDEQAGKERDEKRAKGGGNESKSTAKKSSMGTRLMSVVESLAKEHKFDVETKTSWVDLVGEYMDFQIDMGKPVGDTPNVKALFKNANAEKIEQFLKKLRPKIKRIVGKPVTSKVTVEGKIWSVRLHW